MSKLSEKLANDEVYFIAEMSANHGNDLELALSIVDAAAEAGADCLKVQTYTADSMTLNCDKDSFMVKTGLWKGRRLYDLYAEGALPLEWHLPIKTRCEELGLDFLSTPFDKDAVVFLADLGVEQFKVASYELVDIPLLRFVAKKNKPILLSTGMGSIDEIGEAVDVLREEGNDDIVLLRCCSEYPANLEHMNLSTIADMRERFGLSVGFSDHSIGFLADIVAVACGACVIEKHFCLDREIATVDAEFSMNPAEFREMVDIVKRAKRATGSPSYIPSAKEEEGKRFRRSIFAVRHIAQGEPFSAENIRVVRPSDGAHPRYYDNLIGQISNREYDFGDPIVLQEADECLPRLL